MGGVKKQTMSLFKTKYYSKSERVKTVYGGEKKKSKETIIKNIRNPFKLKKENEAIKDRIVREIKTLFEQEEKDYYKPIRVDNFWSNNYIEYESSGDENKNLSVKEYLDKIKHYLRNIIINLQKFDTCKTQLTNAITFISFKVVDEEHVIHSKINDIELMPCDNENEVANELFESLRSRYQIGLETSMRGSDFIFDSIQLLYYKCDKINLNVGVIYWFSRLDKIEKSNNKSKNEDDKYFQYAATVALNHEEIKRDPQRISKIKTFINFYNWNGKISITIR